LSELYSGAKALYFWACFGTAEQLAEKVTKDDKTIPQGLKPESFCSSYGTAEAVP
jgi:hypothetical protein